MFPESYNQLRKELLLHWNDPLRKPYWGYWKCGWAMAFDAETFIEYMNSPECCDGAFNIIAATNDREKEIGFICERFLTALRRRRGEPNP